MYRDAVSMSIQDVIVELEKYKADPEVEWTGADEELLTALRDPTSDAYQNAAQWGVEDTVVELEADKANPDVEWTDTDEELLDALKNRAPS